MFSSPLFYILCASGLWIFWNIGKTWSLCKHAGTQMNSSSGCLHIYKQQMIFWCRRHSSAERRHWRASISRYAEMIQGRLGIPDTLVGQICSSLHILHNSSFRLEMTCVIGHEYQCHACQEASIQLHLMHVTSLAAKRLQWAAGGGGGRWCTGWILVAEALTRSPENKMYVTLIDVIAIWGSRCRFDTFAALCHLLGKYLSVWPHAQTLKPKILDTMSKSFSSSL